MFQAYLSDVCLSVRTSDPRPWPQPPGPQTCSTRLKRPLVYLNNQVENFTRLDDFKVKTKNCA